jgi:hypothetical protein
MLLSVHIAEVGVRTAITTLRRAPDPDAIQGLRFARSFLTLPLRTGMMPSLTPTGVLLIAAWDDDESLDKFLFHRRAEPYKNGWRVRMTPVRSIGQLPGLPDLPRQEQPTGDQPVAALTLGRLRADKTVPFLVASGSAERNACTCPGFIDGLAIFRPPMAVGTFSLWRNAREMRQYVTGTYPGGHKKAMSTDQEQRFWHERLFSRHLPYSAEGQWKGRNPLEMLEPATGPGRANGTRSQDRIGIVSGEL